jgi:4-diphosphocytidyl-2-C-methyl-D-erythritol kinase
MRPLTVTAPAKVNLFLGVGAVRPDGFHAVQTIMHTLELADTLTLTPADDLCLTCDRDLGIAVAKNLAYRAAQAFLAAFKFDVLPHIQLVKRIPSGAGLGGGSSDAAAVLAGLAHWAGLPRDDDRLVAIASSLGADVPFFLRGGAALMSGRGDEFVCHLRPLEVDVVLVKPIIPVPTPEAYHTFDSNPQVAGDVSVVAEVLGARDARQLAQVLSNNLTLASTSLVPEIAKALAFLDEEEGVVGSLMAGSGSAVFALCEDAQTAQRVACTAADRRGWWSAATRMSANGPIVIPGESAK